MTHKSPKVPAYSLHKSSGQARVLLHGQHVYLGRHGTPESREKYDRLVGEWLAKGRQTSQAPSSSPASPRRIKHLLLAFWEHVKERYVKHGKPTSEQQSFHTALRPVRQLYGDQFVTDFGPLALTTCREKLIEAGICRKRINQHVKRIRRMFKWGVALEMVPVGVWQALSSVEALKPGKAYDPPPIRQVPDAHVHAIEQYVTPQIWAMVQFQLWTACRPGEVCDIRTIDIKEGNGAWEYRPATHKTEHHGKDRVVYLGPHTQDLIKPWLKSEHEAYLFSPREARESYFALRAASRKSKRTPSQFRRKRKQHPKRPPSNKYTVAAYGRAIQRACHKAGIPTWSPNQLRHNAATRIRSAHGIEASRIILGHSSAVTTEIYAEIDRDRARETMTKLG